MKLLEIRQVFLFVNIILLLHRKAGRESGSDSNLDHCVSASLQSETAGFNVVADVLAQPKMILQLTLC